MEWEILRPRGKEVAMPCGDLQEPGLKAGGSLVCVGMEEAGAVRAEVGLVGPQLLRRALPLPRQRGWGVGGWGAERWGLGPG